LLYTLIFSCVCGFRTDRLIWHDKVLTMLFERYLYAVSLIGTYQAGQRPSNLQREDVD
jgi:hypothetical protein